MPELKNAISRAERMRRWRLRAKDLRERARTIAAISPATRDTYLQLATNYDVMIEQLAAVEQLHSGALAAHLAVCEEASRRAGC